jgi:hypothetical protein
MRKRSWFALLGVLVAVLLVGCAGPGGTSDDDRRPVFYGGVTGGHTSP